VVWQIWEPTVAKRLKIYPQSATELNCIKCAIQRCFVRGHQTSWCRKTSYFEL